MSGNGKPPEKTAEENGVPPLTQLYFYLTQGCNLACRHCYLAPKFDPEAKAALLSVEHFETAIREATPLGLSAVKLTGGEPLLHPQIETLLEFVQSENLSMRLETNGVLCSSLLAKRIAACRNAFVSVSLDGADAETHEWVRGVRGCFEAAKQGIRNLVDAGLPPQVIFTVMRRNVDQIEAVIALAEELGGASVKFNIVQPMGRGDPIRYVNGAGALDVRELIRIGRWVETDVQPRTKLRLHFDYPMAFRPLSRIANGNGGACGILSILGVLPGGHYAICGVGESVADLVYGEVGRDRLDTIWRRHPRLKQLREGVPEALGGICGECLMKRRCLGSCVAQNYQRSGSLLAPHWFCVEANKAGHFPASRLGVSYSEKIR